MENSGPILVWFRRDLRLADNPALSWAADTGQPVIPVFVLEAGDCGIGGASRWWLHGSLSALGKALERLNSRLILRRGPAERIIAALARETKAAAVAWNRLYDPGAIQRDGKIEARCRENGVALRSFNASLLFEPWTVRTAQGSPYRVFTPFWRQCLRLEPDPPGLSSPSPASPASWPASEALESWNLRNHDPDRAAGFRRVWRPGEEGALRKLERFLNDGVSTYREDRDAPGKSGTSMLSPHLHFGEIGPRQIAAALGRLREGEGKSAFMRELGWREFSHHLLFHNPDMGAVNLRSEFDCMPWRDDAEDLRRWQRGRTGYPLVDAGMRELRTTGWMHNRVRMVAASFLTKHLMIDWRLGADWFLDALVDADLANNSAGWQWVAGCGADAAPYFRIFNPVAQSRRFDAGGRYLRTWLPELRRLPDRLMHAPWQAPAAALAEAGLRLGEDYPLPVVDHAEARRRAMDVYRTHVRRSL